MENSECILCMTCVDGCSKKPSEKRSALESRRLMKITILNGNPQPSGFDSYLDHLQTTLEAGGHTVTRLDLRSMNLHSAWAAGAAG